jgi:hypothetical protein
MRDVREPPWKGGMSGGRKGGAPQFVGPVRRYGVRNRRPALADDAPAFMVRSISTSITGGYVQPSATPTKRHEIVGRARLVVKRQLRRTEGVLRAAESALAYERSDDPQQCDASRRPAAERRHYVNRHVDGRFSEAESGDVLTENRAKGERALDLFVEPPLDQRHRIRVRTLSRPMDASTAFPRRCAAAFARTCSSAGQACGCRRHLITATVNCGCRTRTWYPPGGCLRRS